jgi:hypothetical protein
MTTTKSKEKFNARYELEQSSFKMIPTNLNKTETELVKSLMTIAYLQGCINTCKQLRQKESTQNNGQ